MKNNNEESTRYYSDIQEKSVCKALNGIQNPNSGAAHFRKGDVVQRDASLLIECKTVMSHKDSISIKKNWIDKNKEEAASSKLFYNCIAFNFGPKEDNYYVIDERLMKFLVEKLIEDNKTW